MFVRMFAILHLTWLSERGYEVNKKKPWIRDVDNKDPCTLFAANSIFHVLSQRCLLQTEQITAGLPPTYSLISSPTAALISSSASEQITALMGSADAAADVGEDVKLNFRWISEIEGSIDLLFPELSERCSVSCDGNVHPDACHNTTGRKKQPPHHVSF